METQKPLLSIGIIFKNDIRSLERCLKALESLRKAIPCELVMADTGSADGSRVVAEQYADILIDFPWVNDFSAARNAVMDQCSGVWYLSVDTDEYLDPDISELVRYLQAPPKQIYPFASIAIYNYRTLAMKKGDYSAFFALRLARLDTGTRYQGTIHEEFIRPSDAVICALQNTILHHDGYAGGDPQKSREKTERNMALLREELKKDPDNLMRLLQCIESSSFHRDERTGYLLQAMERLQSGQKVPKEKECVPPHLYRHAIHDALQYQWPQAMPWLAWGEEHMSHTITFRIDVCADATSYFYKKKDYETALSWEERYEEGVSDYDQGKYNLSEKGISPLFFTSSATRILYRLIRCECLLLLDRQEECVELLEELNFDQLTQENTAMSHCLRIMSQMTECLERIQALCARILAPLWEQEEPDSCDKEKEERKKQRWSCIAQAVPLFQSGKWAIFLQTSGSLGISARSMNIEEPEKISVILEEVEQWSEIPVPVLSHAIKCLAVLPDSFYRQEEAPLRGFAAALGQQSGMASCLAQWAERDSFTTSLARCQFLFLLVAATLRGDEWKIKLDVEHMNTALTSDWETEKTVEKLCKILMDVASAYIPKLYHPELLAREDDWMALPGLHRFGLYLMRAREALDRGDDLGYVRTLRAALEAAPAMKNMVKLLTNHVEQKKRQNASPELLELAEKVRTILAQYPPDDPAVMALKQSEVYQKVAYLIEGMEAPVFGGLPQ